MQSAREMHSFGPPQSMPKERLAAALNGKSFRWGIAGVLLLVGITSAATHVFMIRPEAAIVNGHTTMLHATIEGMVEFDQVTKSKPIVRQDPLVTVKNYRINEGVLHQLATERDGLARRVLALNDQEKSMLALKDELDERMKSFKEGAIEALGKEAGERAAAREAIRASLIERELELKRQKELSAAGAGTLKALQQAQADRDRLSYELARIEAELSLNETLQRQAAKGVFVSASRFGSTYMEQRKDEISIRLLEMKSTREEQEARIAKIDRQIAAEEKRLRQSSRVELKSPVDGIVWRVMVPNKTDVTIGQELIEVLDCTSTFLDILVSDKRYEQIAIGDVISYRLAGSKEFQQARVIAKRGPSAVEDDRTLAARLDKHRSDSFRIWAQMLDEKQKSSSADFCDIGRRAEIKFTRKAGLVDGLRPTINAF